MKLAKTVKNVIKLKNSMLKKIKRQTGCILKIFSVLIFTIIYIPLCFAINESNISKKEQKILEQKQIIEILEKKDNHDYKNVLKVDALRRINELRLTLKEASINELKNNIDSSVMIMDIMEDKNLDIILRNILVISKKEFSLEEIQREVSETVNILDTYICENCVEDEKYQMKIVSSLISIVKKSKDAKCISNNLINFLESITNAYEVRISRKAANDLLEKNREKIECLMESTSNSKGINFSTDTDAAGLEIGAEVSLNKSEGGDESVLYRIDKGGNLKISFGGTINKLLKAEVSGNIGITASAIFYSLEQYLDSKERPTCITLCKDEIEKLIMSRDLVKKKEKELISNFRACIEVYMKAKKIIPDIIYIEWPKITETKYQYRANSIKGKVEGAITVLNSIGVNVGASKEYVMNTRVSPYLSLISKDCSSVDGISAKNIKNFFYKKNRNEKTKKYNPPIYNLVKSLVKEGQNKEGILSLILGDLRQYNNAVALIAFAPDKVAIKKEMEIKRSIQQKWLGRKKIGDFSRRDMLIAAITVASYMREVIETDSELYILRQIYQEMLSLSKLQYFSKNVKNHTFNTSYMTEKFSIDGGLDIKIPIVGDINTSFEYEYSEDKKENIGEEFKMRLDLPILKRRVLALQEALKEISNVGGLLANQDRNAQAAQIGVALEKASKYISKADINSNSKLTINEPATSIWQKDYLSITVYLTKIQKTIKGQQNEPLPGENIIIKNEDKWVLKNIKISKISKKSMGPVYSAREKYMIIMGDNTLSYIKDRYNVYRQSREGEVKENSLWQNFKNLHFKEIKKMIKNISLIKSNIMYELQDMYNKIIEHNPKDHKLKNELYYLIANFIMKCKNFKESHEEKDFMSAIDFLEDILDIQFKYDFIKNQNIMFSISD